MSTPEKRLFADRIALSLIALCITLLFIQEPGLGDDFQYWWMAADMHLRGPEGWSPDGFHYLRWPVWGVCWVLQGIFGPGLLSFYLVPFFYTLCGAQVAFELGRKVLNSRGGAWACALAYLLHPLLDTLIYRPMPDLSEGVLIGIAVLCWYRIMEQSNDRGRIPPALAAGLITAVLFANRITGVFVFGVLASVALVGSWKNTQFTLRQAAFWFGVIALTGLFLVSLEGLFYYGITGDFFHSIHANLGARGRKGTEPIPLWWMPFRFFQSLWTGNPLAPLYSGLAILGGWQIWRRGGVRGRMVVAWAVTLYLAYNCAVQSVFPPRPLLRNADRFLCSLAIPLSILCIGGLNIIISKWRVAENWTRRRPVITGCLAVVMLVALTSRSYFDLGYIPELRAYLRALPEGTRIFTHDAMRFAAMLADSKTASRFQWHTKKSILHPDTDCDQFAARSDEFWYCRKIIWLADRKKLENDEIDEQEVLGDCFAKPYPTWGLRQIIRHGSTPDFVFYRKRDPSNASPNPVPLASIIPDLVSFPAEWNIPCKTSYHLKIPEAIRGKSVRFEVYGMANTVQAVTVAINYFQGNQHIQKDNLKPYFHEKQGLDFHALHIPANADSCTAHFKFAPDATNIRVEQILVVIEP